MQKLEQEVRRTVLLALNEDRYNQDITSLACVSEEKETQAKILLKQDSRVAGLKFLPWILEIADPFLKYEIHTSDGQDLKTGTTLATITGKAQSLLACERTILNLLQHASGIASKTLQYVQAINGFDCDILDTRKTLPGLRAIQKYAVVVGGGKNHRFDLEDRFLIKSNHLKLLKEDSSHPVQEAIRRSRALRPKTLIEIEVENLTDLEEALSEKPEIILLDNMSPTLVAEAVKIGKGRTYLEASGGINLSNVREYAMAGVDGIAIGALTHSVSAVDLCMRIS